MAIETLSGEPTGLTPVTEIISGEIGGPYLADGGDTILVSKSGHISGVDTYGVTNREGDDHSVSVIVAGDIHMVGGSVGGSASYGVGLYGREDEWDSASPANNSVTVRASGEIRAEYGIVLGGGSNSVEMNGAIFADDTGIDTKGPDTSIVVAGLISAAYGIRSEGERTSIDVSGEITATGSALSLSDSEFSEIVISGAVSGAWGLDIHNSPDTRIVNSGSIQAGFEGVVSAVRILDSDRTLLENTGSIEGRVGVMISGEGSALVNDGWILGSETGVQVSQAAFLNTGTIESDDKALVVYGGSNATNDGQIAGDVYLELGAANSFVNSGTIAGDVFLETQEVNAFHAGSGVIFGSVSGGHYNDTIVGNKQDDLYLGNRGDDVLAGRAGDDRLEGGEFNDTLRGGRGDDTLVGGNQDDVLSGGRGRDVFSFDTGSGEDTVRDFTQGKDVIEITHQRDSFETLQFQQVDSDLIVTHDSGTIVLSGLAGTVLTESDFLFG